MARMGRPPGAKNKRTLARAEHLQEMLASGISPIEVIVGMMRGTLKVDQFKLQCAIAAAPYVHPRLASTEVNMDATVRQCVVSDKPLTPEQWLEQYGDTSYAKVLEGVEVKVLEDVDRE